MKPEKIIRHCLEKNIAFALWRYPGKQIQGAFSHEAIPVKKEKMPEERGFFMALFHPEKDIMGYSIPATLAWAESLTNEALEKIKTHPPDAPTCVHITARQEYIEAFNQMKTAINSGQATKVVLSRTKETSLVNRKNAADLFVKLQKSYPAAMVYIFNIPQRGSWLGATPEMLLSKEGQAFETVALAGTRPAEEPATWGQKEIHEQAVVSAFIEQALHTHQVNHFHREGPETCQAGNLVHLKTTFHIPEDQMGEKYLKVAQHLHPTPAVCGIPRDRARALIGQTEKHRREFYSGFLGEINPGKQEVNLYVNLRCMQVFTDKAVLYAGGGLTRGSTAGEEWAETQAKCRTLLNVAENL